VPRIFKLIQKKGNVAEKEMYRALNMGIGMILVLAKTDVDKSIEILRKTGVRSYVIGKVVRGNRKVEIV